MQEETTITTITSEEQTRALINSNAYDKLIESYFPEQSKHREFIDWIHTTLSDKKREDGTDVFVHSCRMVEILESYSVPMNSSFVLGILMHDLIYVKSQLTRFAGRTDNQELIEIIKQIYYQQSSTAEEITEIEYALGVAKSSEAYEAHAQQWRYQIADALSISTDGSQTQLVNNRIRESIANAKSISIHEVQDHNYQTFRDRLFSVMHNGGEEITPEMLYFEAPLTDLDSLKDLMRSWDIEGLLIHAAELIDNMRNPRKSHPGSQFKDMQTLLHFVAPIVEAAGFKKMGQDLYDVALRYRFKEFPELLNWAESLNSQGTEFMASYSDEIIKTIIKTAVYPIISIQRRVKSTGSIASKAKKYDNKIPDTIGFLALIQDDENLTDAEKRQRIIEFASGIVKGLTSSETFNASLKAGDVRDNEPGIEIRLGKDLGDNKQHLVFKIDDQIINVMIAGARLPSGYESTHVNFYLQTESGKLGIEIQIETPTSYINNTFGEASHILYKAKRDNLTNSKKPITGTNLTATLRSLYKRGSILRNGNHISNIEVRKVVNTMLL